MSESPVASLEQHFGSLEDPRVDRTKLHELLDILVIAICAAICGADGWVDVELFGNAKLNWLCQFLTLPNGIPSHDTFGRVFARLDPEQFEICFLNWVQAVFQVTQGQVVPIDGKRLRRSRDGSLGKAAIEMVSAWAAANHLTLGQCKVDEQSNEITAIPELLQVLELSGCIVTIDAIGCQTEIAQAIRAKEADYVLALKENQGTLYRDVAELFTDARQVDFQGVEYDYHQTVNKGHGRIEIRRFWTISDPDFITYVDPKDKWLDLACIGMVEAERRIGDETSRETRYYISSLSGEAVAFAEAVRGHWSIENSCHWILDIAFREDECRVRKANGAQNFAVLRRIALNLLKQEHTAKCGIKAKRLKAGWDEAYLLKVLAG